MTKPKKLIILDRDGVLNAMVVNPEHGTIDSPLHPDQVVVAHLVPKALKTLQSLGYSLSIATNQPAAAKGKTTQANLEAVHERVLQLICSEGATIASSHICWHRAEDHCTCRKPKPGLLWEALHASNLSSDDERWMVGDGVTDLQAGAQVGARLAFIGAKHCSSCRVLSDHQLSTTFLGTSLHDFSEWLVAQTE